MSAEALPLLRNSVDELETTTYPLPTEFGDDSSHANADESITQRASRLALERSLVRKLDVRMSILVLIYILNYVRTR